MDPRAEIPVRTIRPALPSPGGAVREVELSLLDVERLAERLVQDARERVAKLEAKAAELSASIEARRAEAALELAERRQALQAEVEEAHRAGFQRGRAEGEARVAAEAAALNATLASLVREIEARRRSLLAAARHELLPLALAIARKVVQREVRGYPPVVIENVKKAVDLAFRESSLVVEVHPLDAALVERYASEAWGSLTGGVAGGVSVRTAEDVGRGGCRVLSRSGMVDLRLETQLGIIEEALREDSGSDPLPPEGRPASTRGVFPR